MFLQGSLNIPIYTGERVRAEIEDSESVLEQRKAESANLRERIAYEIRAANLDIQTAAEQVRVAQVTRDLAQQQLVQAQDRFAAGVANGLEVTQAQEAVAGAEDSYITSLFGLNIAQASCAGDGLCRERHQVFFWRKVRNAWRKPPRAKWLLIPVVLVLIIGGYAAWEYLSKWESTDDAQVDGHIHPVNAKVGGTVLIVNVKENDRVEASADPGSGGRAGL